MIENPGIEHCEIHGESFSDEDDSISRHIELGWNAAFEWMKSQENMFGALTHCAEVDSWKGLTDSVMGYIAEEHEVIIGDLKNQWYVNNE